MKVILISAKAQHGKDTVAEMLKDMLEHDGKKVLIAHYADLLKYICKTFFKWDGKKDEAGRALLQWTGTNKIRSMYPEFWVKFIFDILTIFKNEWDYVLIPDCRFKNEIRYFKDSYFNTTTLRVERLNFVSPLTQEQQNHPSEVDLDDYKFDYYITSESGLDELKNKVQIFYEEVLNESK
jgi:phosphomevalonate kinase